MLYIGTKKQRCIIVDCIEEIDNTLVWGCDDNINDKLLAERAVYEKALNRGFGFVKVICHDK